MNERRKEVTEGRQKGGRKRKKRRKEVREEGRKEGSKRIRIVKTPSPIVPLVKDYDLSKTPYHSYHWNEW